MYVGGSDGKTATDTTFVAPLYSGTFGPWQAGPALPAPRTAAAIAVFNSAVYVVGGSGPDGKPTDTVFVASQDLETGEIRRVRGRRHAQAAGGRGRGRDRGRQ